MKGKRSVLIMLLVTVLVGGTVLGYSWRRENQNAQTFAGSGYVLLSDADSGEKQALFQSGTVWRSGLSDTVSFHDVQGNQVKVSGQSFAHYDNKDVAALSDGVVVDLSSVDNGQMTNHYAVSNKILFSWNGSAYQMNSASTDLAFRDYIWKLSAEKYMVCSSGIQVHFADDDVREAGDFIEVTYIDGGVIQVQTEENLWQTVSDNCYATLENGEIVNLSLRNVSDGDGTVLMDFSKIVLGADDNIEVTPLTEELENVKESVIPHFDITAENGKDGAQGGNGTNGELGQDGEQGISGEQGDPGTAGSNGAAGSAGSNGAAGSPGAPGSSGNDGSSATIEGTVLDYPKFRIENWKVTSTSCSGTVKVTNADMLSRAVDHSQDCIYVIDMDRNVEAGRMHCTFSEDSTGISFEINNLEPDHNYRLVVTANMNTGLKDAVDYMRDFISKTFWTDSVGIYLEAGEVTVDTASVTVREQEYATSPDSVMLYLYSSRDGADNVSADNMVNTQLVGSSSVMLNSGSGSVRFPDLQSNTCYYARSTVKVGNKTMLLKQILPLTTLKKTATVGAPSLTPNRDSWGFDITPGALYDPDGGVMRVGYEFYAEGSVDVSSSGNASLRANAEPVRTVTTVKTGGITVPLDGTALLAGSGYYVRAVLHFQDNEKEIEIASPLSNRAQVTGSKLPTVYFTNMSDAGGESTQAAETSDWYDQLYGVLTIAPSGDSAQVLLDHDHHPTVTIRASGYYYVQYPVYLEDDNGKPANGNYLLAEKKNGYVLISLKGKNLAAAREDAGTVTGLRPDTQYQVIVTGDLSNDGVNAYAQNTRVGACVVETPDLTAVQLTWSDSATPSAGTKFTTVLKMEPGTTQEERETFARQMETLTSLRLTLRSGSAANPGTELAALELNSTNYKTYVKDGATFTSLGEAISDNGLELSETSFGLDATRLNTVSSVYIAAENACDYTVRDYNRVNQKAYASTDSNDVGAPGSSTSDGAVYVNEFELKNNSHDIRLGDAPDTLPNSGDGFDKDALKTDKAEDGYLLKPNYLNSAKLARTITFYAFDAPDYEAAYASADGWRLSGEFANHNGTNLPICAVTAVNAAGEGAWLGKVTVEVPANGTMPSARFVPMTVENYYKNLYQNEQDGDQKAAAAAAAYHAGTTKDEKGAYLFFYNDAHASEPTRGHQFVYAWTMSYELESTPDGLVQYYPFDVLQSMENLRQRIPHSEAQDAPFDAPKFYALPYESDGDSATWSVSILDPDGALSETTDGKTQLYRRNSAIAAEILTGALARVDETSQLMTADSLVTLERRQKGESVPVAARVQWYTDKYTVDGGGIFDGTDVKGYTASTIAYSTKTQTMAGNNRVIPYYENVFVYYDQPAASIPAAGGVKVELKEATTSGSQAVNRYDMKVTAPLSEMKKANGIRLTFTSGSDRMTLDKYLDGGADSVNLVVNETDNTAEITCTVSLGRDLTDFAGRDHVSIQATLLYETGEEGFAYIQPGATVSIRTYSSQTDTAFGTVLIPSGRYRFNAQGSLGNLLENAADLPRMGSFFRFDDPDTEMTLTTAENGTLTGKLILNSTRHSSFLDRTGTLNFDPGQGLGAASGLLSVVPCELKETPALDLTIQEITGYDQNGEPVYGDLDANDFRVPTAVPIISYGSPQANANSAEGTFAVSPAGTEIWLMVEKYVDGSWQLIRQDATTGLWENAPADVTYDNPDASALNEVSGTSYRFNALDGNTRYRLTAVYQEDGAYKKLNMYNNSGVELTNYLLVQTFNQPTVYLSTSYNAYSYAKKYIAARVAVSNVSNYYYTLELCNSQGEFLTYLDCGGPNSATNGRINVYDVGQNVTPAGTTTQDAVYRGRVYKSLQFDQDTHELIAGTEQLKLSFGAQYLIRVRVYDIGKGPAYGGTELDDLANGVTGTLHSITVKNQQDDMQMTGVFELRLNSEGESEPTITFTPTFVRRADVIRGNVVAIMVVRSRLNDATGEMEQTDVTHLATFGADGRDLSQDTFNADTTSRIYLTDPITGEDAFREGDVYTCYLYGIRDNLNQTNTMGVSGSVDRSAILQGRAVGGSVLPTQDAVPVDRGTSELLISREVTFVSAETSAGEVTVLRSGKTFTVQLDSPVNQAYITHMMWSVTAQYTAADGTIDFITESSKIIPTQLRKMNATNYQMDFVPTFAELPEGVTVNNYTVSIQFYREVTEADGSVIYDSSQIGMKPGKNATVAEQPDGGLRLSIPLDGDAGLRSTLMSLLRRDTAALPEETKMPEATETGTLPEETSDLTKPEETTTGEEAKTPDDSGEPEGGNSPPETDPAEGTSAEEPSA